MFSTLKALHSMFGTTKSFYRFAQDPGTAETRDQFPGVVAIMFSRLEQLYPKLSTVELLFFMFSKLWSRCNHPFSTLGSQNPMTAPWSRNSGVAVPHVQHSEDVEPQQAAWSYRTPC
jgi:hypothetical protein